MNNNIAAKFMKAIEQVVQYDTEISLFVNNINPLRVSLMLYRAVDVIAGQFSYSEKSTSIIKEKIVSTLSKVLNSYQDTEELTFLIEQQDFNGKNCFWYMNEYSLYEILSCRMLDKVILNKWHGKYELNSQIIDSSTSYCLLTDTLKIFASDNVFLELYFKIFTVD